MATRDLTVNLIANTDRLTGPLQRVGGKLQTVGRNLTLGVTGPLAAFGAMSVSAASDLQESMSKVDVVFGDNARAIQEWARGASSNFGQSTQQALEAAGTFGNLFNTMGLGASDASAMSMGLVELATDLASFNNADPTQVLEAIRSGLVGETEPLRAFGVNLSAAAVKAKAMEMGLADANGELSDAALAQARYALIMEQTTSAQGDFDRTSNGLANRTRTLKARFADLSANLGSILLPIAEQVVGVAMRMAEWFDNLSPGMQETIVKIAGVAAAAGPLLIAGGKLVSSLSKIGSAFKVMSKVFKANPYLLLIAATVALVVLIVKNWDKIKAKATEVWNKVKSTAKTAIDAVVGFVKSIPGRIGDFASSLLQKGKDLLAGLGSGIADVWTNVVYPWLKDLPAKAIGAVPGLLETLVSRGKQLLNGLKDGVLGVWNDVLKPWLTSFATKALTAVPSLLQTLVSRGKQLLNGVKNGVMDVWNNTVKPWLAGIGTAVLNAVPSLLETLKEKGKDVIGGLKGGIDEAWGGVTSFFSDVGGAITGAFANAGSWLWNAGRNIVSGLWNGFWSGVTSLIPAWARSFLGIGGGGPSLPGGGAGLSPGSGGGGGGRGGGSHERPQAYHDGGIVQGRFGQEVLAILQAGEEVIPIGGRRGANGGGDTYYVTVQMPPGSNGEDLVRALQRFQRANGPLPLRVAG